VIRDWHEHPATLEKLRRLHMKTESIDKSAQLPVTYRGLPLQQETACLAFFGK
jgi:hypothetical protein